MHRAKKTAGNQSRNVRGTAPGHKHHAQSTAKRDDFRSAFHNLVWVPSTNEHMLIL